MTCDKRNGTATLSHNNMYDIPSILLGKIQYVEHEFFPSFGFFIL